MYVRLAACLAAAFIGTAPTLAQNNDKRETWIPVYVTPYYMAADTENGVPRTAVGGGFDPLLSSQNPEDILAARDAIQANPGTVTPFSMMALAIRLYDTGQRDEAVLWFYIARNRAITLFNAVQFDRGPMSDGVYDAVGSFISLAGPYINGYAFCDLEKQKRANVAAIDWVEANPYQTIFAPALRDRAKTEDLNASIRDTIADLRDAAKAEAVQFSDAAFLANFNRQREANGMNEKFCWAD